VAKATTKALVVLRYATTARGQRIESCMASLRDMLTWCLQLTRSQLLLRPGEWPMAIADEKFGQYKAP